MLPIAANSLVDLSEDLIDQVLVHLNAYDLRSSSLVCGRLYHILQKNNINLSDKLIQAVALHLDLQSLQNCSLTSRQLGRAIHKDNFWQKKANLDFAPLYQPLAPYKEWYKFQYSHELDRMPSSLYSKKRIECIFMESLDKEKNKVRCSLLTMNKSNQFYMLKHKDTMIAESTPEWKTTPSIFLVGYNAALAHAAAAFRSCDFSENTVFAPHLFKELPNFIQDEVYEKVYETLSHPELYEPLTNPWECDLSPLLKGKVGENAFYDTINPIKPETKALAIENYLLIDQFPKFLQKEKNQVYNELYGIVKPSAHYWGWGEHAFHDQHGVSSTHGQKIEAIQNYLGNRLNCDRLIFDFKEGCNRDS